MNKVNDVFLVVKDYCTKNPSTTDVCDFTSIAELSQIDMDDLDSYLGILKKMGLIRYSMRADKYLFLTSFGAQTKTLISGKIQNE